MYPTFYTEYLIMLWDIQIYNQIQMHIFHNILINTFKFVNGMVRRQKEQKTANFTSTQM